MSVTAVSSHGQYYQFSIGVYFHFVQVVLLAKLDELRWEIVGLVVDTQRLQAQADGAGTFHITTDGGGDGLSGRFRLGCHGLICSLMRIDMIIISFRSARLPPH